MNKYQAVVLLSGGQDSTTCLHYAIKQHGADNLLALSIAYNQRHAIEMEASAQIAAAAGVDRVAHSLDVIGQVGDSALVNEGETIHAEGRDDEEGKLPTSWVPGRNMMFFGLASMVAVKHKARIIYAGVCQTDYSGYPDCRQEFVEAMQVAATLAMPTSLRPIEIRTPLMKLDKKQTVELAHSLGIDSWLALGHSVTCYEGQRPGCGECPACELRARGFEDAGMIDPATM